MSNTHILYANNQLDLWIAGTYVASMETVGTPLLWGGFTLFVLAMLAIDLGVFHRKQHEVRFKEAIGWTFVWITLAMVFNGLVLYWFGSGKALEFLTAYVIEKALSVDNIFVFVVLFGSFAVPKILQHSVLFWGVLGALVFRAIFILAGAALLHRFHWLIYVFGLLQRALAREPEASDGYRHLAIAYSRKGDNAQADLASAQAAFACPSPRATACASAARSPARRTR